MRISCPDVDKQQDAESKVCLGQKVKNSGGPEEQGGKRQPEVTWSGNGLQL